MKKRNRLCPAVWVTAVLLLAVMLLHPAEFIDTAVQSIPSPAAFAGGLEQYLQKNFPLRSLWKNIAVDLQVAGGTREFNGVFLAEDDSLIRNFETPEDDLQLKGNVQEVIRLAERSDRSTYLMVIPTACAIYQEKLPEYLPLYNQKSALEQISRSVYGSVSMADAYLPLYAERENYLYYRTDPGLTARGSFVVYQTLAKRMGFVPHELSSFQICRLQGSFYGELYDRWESGGIRGDTVTYYQSVASERSFSVTHYSDKGTAERIYYTLFPEEAALTGTPTDILLGGRSPVIEINSVGASTAPTLLVLDDGTARGVIPFLAMHYRRITYVDLTLIDSEQACTLSIEDYNHILLTASLETMVHTELPEKLLPLIGGK